MNENFNITCESWRTMFSPEGGYEMVVFDVWVQYTGGDEGPFEEPLWFDEILEWLKEHDIEVYGRISATLVGMDSKETTQLQLVEELHKNGMDMNELAIKVTNARDLEARRQHFLWLLEQVKDLPDPDSHREEE